MNTTYNTCTLGRGYEISPLLYLYLEIVIREPTTATSVAKNYHKHYLFLVNYILLAIILRKKYNYFMNNKTGEALFEISACDDLFHKFYCNKGDC